MLTSLLTHLKSERFICISVLLIASLLSYLVFIFIYVETEDSTPKRLHGHPLPKNLCFHSNQASERGTEVAIYDYADFAELLYGFKSKMIFPDTPKTHSGMGLPLFKSRFEVGFYKIETAKGDYKHDAGGPHLLSKAYEMNCDYLYILKTGREFDKPEYTTSYKNSKIPVGIHSVFIWEPHSSAFAAISPTVTKGIPGRAVVPHMIREIDFDSYLRVEGLRQELQIPKSALVLCRHGAKDAFDVNWVQDSVWELAHRYNSSQLHFIFLNTNYFPPSKTMASHLQIHYHHHNSSSNIASTNLYLNHSQVHFLPRIEDRGNGFNRFFRTCDAMLHARVTGENFGLAPAEFSIRNLPVISMPGSLGNEHLRILGDKAYRFHNKTELFSLIEEFVHHGIPKKDYNGHRDFAPVPVMKAFVKAFLEPVFGRGVFDHRLKMNSTLELLK